jgi:uncharacterized membrane protein
MKVWHFMSSQFKYLFAGIVTWIPIGFILLVIFYVAGIMEDLGQRFFDFFLPKGMLPVGLGIIFWILIFYLTGLVFNRTPVSHLFSRIPVIGLFFSRTGEAMTLEKLTRLTPCVFLYSSTCVSYGWILWDQPIKLNGTDTGFSMITVYYPNVPALLSGEIYLLRKEAVVRLGNSTQEMINVLLYGLKKPDTLKYLPWIDETDSNFTERMASFALPPWH